MTGRSEESILMIRRGADLFQTQEERSIYVGQEKKKSEESPASITQGN